jgi:threonyl-tRNA synthetase
MSLAIHLPDQSIKELPEGATGETLAASIGPRLAQAALAIKVEGRLMDLSTPLATGTHVEIITNKSPESLELLRHSTAHLLAHAVKRLFPQTQVGIGPVIEDGFYYDFKVDRPFTADDLILIEAEMKKIVKEDIRVTREVLSRPEAMDRFKQMGEHFKVDILAEIPVDEAISGYHQGDFYDLCRGPHIPRTGKAGAFKLTHVAGAYWKGDEKNPMLSRIYGTAFHTPKELEDYLALIEEAKRRDHRKLGKELDLFSFHPEAPASPFFHPKGTTVYNELVKYMRELYFKYGYQEVITPQILDTNLWRTSGHMDNYSDNMYFTEAEERDFAVKPMNCPTHCLMFASTKHSYRELPKRIADFGRLHRLERSGVTHGLTRVRSFCQDDAHIFCTEAQIKQESVAFLDLLKEVYATFGFHEVKVALSTRPAKRLGADETWDQAEKALADALIDRGYEFTMNPGEGAFYGPKIEFQVFDALKRPWQLGTLQLDFLLPQRFHLKYIQSDGTEAHPVMLHRAILGSLERFFGILVEHCGGAFPVWLAPVQMILLPITDRANAMAEKIEAQAHALGIRAELDLRNEKVNAKIRDAQLQKIPYMVVLGDREVETGQVALRHRTQGDLGQKPLEALLAEISQEIRARA